MNRVVSRGRHNWHTSTHWKHKAIHAEICPNRAKARTVKYFAYVHFTRDKRQQRLTLMGESDLQLKFPKDKSDHLRSCMLTVTDTHMNSPVQSDTWNIDRAVWCLANHHLLLQSGLMILASLDIRPNASLRFQCGPYNLLSTCELWDLYTELFRTQPLRIQSMLLSEVWTSVGS